MGRLRLNVSVIHKKPIDDKLVLTNEFHHSLDILEGQPHKIVTQNGMSFVLNVRTYDVEKSGKLIEINTKILMLTPANLKTISEMKVLTTLNKEAALETRDSEGSIVDILMIPLDN